MKNNVKNAFYCIFPLVFTISLCAGCSPAVSLDEQSQVLNNLPTTNNDSTNKETFGSFYTLEEVLNLEVFSDNDLMNICYRNNYNHLYDDSGSEIDVPLYSILPIIVLDGDVSEKIIADYYITFIENNAEYQEEGIDISCVSIDVYCGKYKGFFAMRFRDIFGLPAAEWIKKYGNYNFYYPYLSGNEVILWKN